jgi:NADH-quinone oxidoreductase subunit C
MADTSNEAGSEAAEADEAAPPPQPATRYGQPVTTSRGQTVLHVSRDDLVDLVRDLRDDERFRVCVDVTAVDYLAYESDRGLPPGV